MFRVTTIAAALAIAGLSGCMTNPKFQCPAPDGVACMSVTEVYDATHFPGAVVGKSSREALQAQLAWAPAPDTAEMAPAPAVALPVEEGSLVLEDVSAAPAVSDALLADAKVVRVWVAPWEDRRGDLHLAGYVFSEVAGKRWRVGNTAPSSRPVLRLLESTAAPTAAEKP